MLFWGALSWVFNDFPQSKSSKSSEVQDFFRHWIESAKMNGFKYCFFIGIIYRMNVEWLN